MKRRKQVTCYCDAYHFPHRIGGGMCNGSAWAESYRINYGEHCVGCNCDTENTCDVVGGGETYRACEAYQFYLHYGVSERLPITLEEDIDAVYVEYYRDLEEQEEIGVSYYYNVPLVAFRTEDSEIAASVVAQLTQHIALEGAIRGEWSTADNVTEYYDIKTITIIPGFDHLLNRYLVVLGNVSTSVDGLTGDMPYIHMAYDIRIEGNAGDKVILFKGFEVLADNDAFNTLVDGEGKAIAVDAYDSV